MISSQDLDFSLNLKIAQCPLAHFWNAGTVPMEREECQLLNHILPAASSTFQVEFIPTAGEGHCRLYCLWQGNSCFLWKLFCRAGSELLDLFTQTLIQQTLVVSVVQWKGVKKAVLIHAVIYYHPQVKLGLHPCSCIPQAPVLSISLN